MNTHTHTHTLTVHLAVASRLGALPFVAPGVFAAGKSGVSGGGKDERHRGGRRHHQRPRLCCDARVIRSTRRLQALLQRCPTHVRSLRRLVADCSRQAAHTRVRGSIGPPGLSIWTERARRRTRKSRRALVTAECRPHFPLSRRQRILRARYDQQVAAGCNNNIDDYVQRHNIIGGSWSVRR